MSCAPHVCGSDEDCVERIAHCACRPQLCLAKKHYSDVVVKPTTSNGWGIFSKQEIPKGKLVCRYVINPIDDAEFKRLLKRFERDRFKTYYCIASECSSTGDPELAGNSAKNLTNDRLCDTNCIKQIWIFSKEICVDIYASRNIPPDTQLIFNCKLKCGKSRRCSMFVGVPSHASDSDFSSKPNVPKKSTEFADQLMESFLMDIASGDDEPKTSTPNQLRITHDNIAVPLYIYCKSSVKSEERGNSMRNVKRSSPANSNCQKVQLLARENDGVDAVSAKKGTDKSQKEATKKKQAKVKHSKTGNFRTKIKTKKGSVASALRDDTPIPMFPKKEKLQGGKKVASCLKKYAPANSSHGDDVVQRQTRY